MMEETEIIDSVAVEVLENLKCANVFILFKELLKEKISDKKIVVIMRKDAVIIQYDGSAEKHIPIKGVPMDPSSLKVICANNKNLHLRLSLIQDNPAMVETFSPTLLPLKVGIDPDKNYMIACKVCDAPLLRKPTSFQKMISLQIGIVQIKDWFCSCTSAESSLDETIMLSGENFAYYGYDSIAFARKYLVNLKENNSHFYCFRCLQYMGRTYLPKNIINFWADCVKLTHNGVETKIFDIYSEEDSAVVRSILQTMLTRNFCDESKVGSCPKIIVESTFPDQHEKYIMLEVIGKNVKTLYGSNSEEGDSIYNLKERTCLKLLYKVVEDKKQPLLNCWKEDPRVYSLPVSYRGFTKFAKTLEENLKIIPPSDRNHKGFLLSYVFYS